MLLINSKQQQKPLIYASKQKKYSSASHCPKKEGNKENKAEAF